MSWVVVRLSDGVAITELFSPELAEKVNTTKYEAVPIRRYLGALNWAIALSDEQPEVSCA